MALYSITDDGVTLKVQLGTQVNSLNKTGLSFVVFGDLVRFISFDKEVYQIRYQDVLVPTVVSAEDFRNQMEALLGVNSGQAVNVTNGAGASAVNIQDGGNSITVDGSVSITSAALTASSPTVVTVTTGSTAVVALNASRKGLVLTNTGTKAVYFGIGTAAVLGSGIYLSAAGGVWVMDSNTFTTAAINGIVSAATTTVSIQEFT